MTGPDLPVSTPRQPLAVEQPFLDTDPPPWAVTGIAWVLLVVTALAVLAAGLIRLPETIEAAFTLEPRRAADPLRAMHLGKVSRIGAAEGAPVERGDVLFVVESEGVADRSSELLEAEIRLRGARDEQRSAGERVEAQARADDQEQKRLAARIRHAERAHAIEKEHVALRQEIADRYGKLHKKGQLDTASYRGHQIELQRATLAAEEARALVEDARHELSRHEYTSALRGLELLEQSRAAGDDAESLEQRVVTLQHELADSIGSRTEIRAPCDGELVGLAVRSAGTVIEEGQVLGEVHCASGGLQARLVLSEGAVGRIRREQRVKLLYDAFPYQRFGVRHGRVRWVSPRSLGDAEGASFQALVDLDVETIVVDGRPRPLRAGMSGTARVMLGRRSLLSFVVEPLRQLREQMSDAPGDDGESSRSDETGP